MRNANQAFVSVQVRVLVASLALGQMAVLSGCRGWASEDAPIHLNPNMDTQEKGKAYRTSTFFADGRMMRQPPKGTVARGYLGADEHFAKGTVNGAVATSMPASYEGSPAQMARGQERYNIYCAPCHGQAGDGMGTVAAKMTVKPPSLHDKRLKELSVGKIHEAIIKGVNNGNMPSYAAQLTPEDRWNVVYYVRALQKSRDPSVTLSAGDWKNKDTDGDTVPDYKDNCPKEKGSVDNKGCAQKQLVEITEDRIEISDTVYFVTGSAEIDKRSHALLNNIAKVLVDHDEVKKVGIFGHTDNQGEAKANLELSQARAAAVKAYLEKNGVVADRLDAQGFGDQKPVGPNDTDEGRAKNRRVEFQIVGR